MPNTGNDLHRILQRSRSVADQADFLSIAWASGDQSRIENAVEDLLAVYDSYIGQAKTYSSYFGFDEVVKLTEPRERDQSTAQALATALIDLEVAVVLEQAARVTGEIEGQVSSMELDEAVTTLKETLKIMEDPSGTVTGMTLFAFDEITATETTKVDSGVDLPTAKAIYQKQVKTLYDTLVTETRGLLVAAFEEVSGLDADKISRGLRTVIGSTEGKIGGKLVPRLVSAIQNALKTLKGLLGSENFGDMENRINKTLAEIHKGEDALQLFLKYLYDYEGGQKNIAVWLKSDKVERTRIGEGIRALNELQQRIIQALALQKHIITNLRRLKSPAEFILKKFGGTLPLDLILAGGFLLMINITLLRGMDYADTAPLINWVDGIITISKHTLGVGEQIVK